MLADDVLIVLQLPASWPYVHVYMIGDKHIGSQQFGQRAFQKQIDAIRADQYGIAVICGDILDWGITGSKTPVYGQAMLMHEQKETAYRLLEPIADKLDAIVPGNHERRGFKTEGINPLYDVACRLRREDVYRENAAVVKVGLGCKAKNGKPVVYAGVVSHGSAAGKHKKYVASYDGADFFVSGHTHQQSYTPRGKRRIDLYNNKVTIVGYKDIVVDPGMDDGGYGLGEEYDSPAPPELQILTLYGDEKRMSFSSEDI